jgi:hypothetical protein
MPDNALTRHWPIAAERKQTGTANPRYAYLTQSHD